MVDVIIPVYKPTEHILSLFLKLSKQTVLPNKVIVINTEKKYWDKFFEGFDILKKYPFIELHHISKEEFDHAKTRNYGISLSKADYFLLMTDDAVPKDEYLIERMLKSFDNKKIGMCYARQIPHKGCHAIEKYTRTFNYPLEPKIKGIADLEDMGIKTFFASDVCCMYRRSVFDKIGPFDEPAIFNEDMIFARKMINDGFLISYEPKAEVRHSHNYSGMQYLKRNFDLGVSQADNPDIFGDVKSEGEGVSLVKKTAVYLCKKAMPWMVIKLVYQSGCKYIGYRLGKKYKSIPKSLALKLTSNKKYIENNT